MVHWERFFSYWDVVLEPLHRTSVPPHSSSGHRCLCSDWKKRHSAVNRHKNPEVETARQKGGPSSSWQRRPATFGFVSLVNPSVTLPADQWSGPGKLPVVSAVLCSCGIPCIPAIFIMLCINNYKRGKNSSQQGGGQEYNTPPPLPPPPSRPRLLVLAQLTLLLTHDDED